MPRTKHAARFKRMRKWEAFNTLPGLAGKRFRREESNEMGYLAVGHRESADVTDDREQQIANALGDAKLARRIMNWWKKYPYATLPELIVLDQLEILGVDYGFQVHIDGGFRQGGLVPDFVVKHGAYAIAILINGNYWHNLPGKGELDTLGTYRLLGQWYYGAQIQAVVIIWESKLMGHTRKSVILNALAGIEEGM